MVAAAGRAHTQLDILLVEPNPGDTRLFTESFDEAKLANRVHVVTDGETALEFVHGRGDFVDAPCPDLILLEARLPRMSAEEVLSALRSADGCRDVPVAVLTSSDTGSQILE